MIISSNDIFHLLIKSIQPSSNWNEGFKAFLVLSYSQELNVGREIQNDNTKFCMVLSKIKTGNDFFIRGLLKFFPKSFFFIIDTFNSIPFYKCIYYYFLIMYEFGLVN